MTTVERGLSRPPIVEAVLDIDCDLPSTIRLDALRDRAKNSFSHEYPRAQRRIEQSVHLEQTPDQTAQTVSSQTASLQFSKLDGTQLVQLRREGYSFNRLAPYGRLDDYLPSIRATWEIFRELTAPIQVRRIALRYINRLHLPMEAGSLNLDKFLRVCPKLPEIDGLALSGFFDQHAAVEHATGNSVNIVLMTEPPEEALLPVIFDIEAFKIGSFAPEDWSSIEETIQSLRRLKNMVFERTVTEACLSQYR